MESLRTVLSPQDFATMCHKAALRTAKNLEGWFSCPTGSCNYGHIHDPAVDGLKFYCQNEECYQVACTACEAPRHEGESCEQFRSRTDMRLVRIRERGQNHIRIRNCPGCNHGIYKTEGCDHITCICGHQFCYACARPFLPEAFTSSILLARHRESCRHYTSDLGGHTIYGISRSLLAEAGMRLRFIDSEKSLDIRFDFSAHDEVCQVLELAAVADRRNVRLSRLQN